MDWKWKHHFVSSKLSQIIGIFLKISKYLNTDTLVLMFNPETQPFLMTCEK